MSEAGYSIRKIERTLNCSHRTIAKYMSGEMISVCSSTLFSGIDKYHDQIVRSLSEGKCRSVLYRELQAIGLTCGKTAAYEYFNLVAKRYNIELTPLESCSSEQKQLRKKIQKYIYISRKKIFDYLWYDEKLDIEPQYFEYLLNRYPIIITLKICIREFRMIFEKHYPQLSNRKITTKTAQ